MIAKLEMAPRNLKQGPNTKKNKHTQWEHQLPSVGGGGLIESSNLALALAYILFYQLPLILFHCYTLV